MQNQATDRNIVAWYTTSEFFEISSAAILAIFIGTPRQEWWGWLAGVVLFLLGVATQFYSNTLESHLKTDLNSGQHVVTKLRLKTLDTVGVGADVLEALSLRLDMPPMPTKDFVSWLEDTLGHERTEEKLQAVLRYTRVNPGKEGAEEGDRISAPAPVPAAPAIPQADGAR